jgi:hypothetical protein
VVFVGSPGVGTDAVSGLRVPAGRVWSTTSRSDIIQYAAVAPATLQADLSAAQLSPVIGPLANHLLRHDRLWFGRNPSDPGFGAHVFASQPGAGHLGYWEPGGRALDGIAAITLGGAP